VDSLSDAELQELSSLKVLYLTTIGRATGNPREIEIWFVTAEGKVYLLAEHFRRAHWVRNIEREPAVTVHLGDRTFSGTARILGPDTDREAWDLACSLERQKYGWGEGLPVEITPDRAQ
jgi:deazaflavin-dependent oxidoreductase (nitroreductase family)